MAKNITDDQLKDLISSARGEVKAVIPHGTVAVVTDPHEIASVHLNDWR